MKEIYEWIYSIIQSCTNQFHLDGCDALIALFHAKFNDKEHTDLLNTAKDEKFVAIHRILN